MLINDADTLIRQAGREAGASRFVVLPISIFAMKQEILPLLGATPQKPVEYAEWKRQAEPSPVFGDERVLVDGRNALNIYRRAGAARILRRVKVHR